MTGNKKTVAKKRNTDDISRQDVAVRKWKKQYALKLLAKNFTVAEVCAHIDTHIQTFYDWRKNDQTFSEKIKAIEAELEKTTKMDYEERVDLVALADKIRPYLQRHLTEKEACAESGISYEGYRSIKKRCKKHPESVICTWFLRDIEQAKLKIYSLAKNTLTNGIKLNPLLAFNFLKSTQPEIYTDGRKELTGPKGERLFHAFPMKPGDYEEFLKQASQKEEIADDV